MVRSRSGFFAAFVVAFGLLAGCAEPQYVRDVYEDAPASRNGIGLTIPSQPSAPRGFQEPAPDIIALKAGLEKVLTDTWFGCQEEFNETQVVDFLEQERYFDAVNSLILNCQYEAGPRARELALKASQGSRRAALDDALAQLDSAIIVQGKALDGADAGTVAEVELLAFLAHIAYNDVVYWRNEAEPRFEELGENVSLRDLEYFFSEYLNAAVDGKTISWFVHAFPWSGGECNVPNPSDVSGSTMELYVDVLRQAPPDPADAPPYYVHRMYRHDLLHDTGPRITYWIKEGWSWPLLWQQELLRWDLRQVANESSPLPSIAEGAFLVDEYRSKTRTLYTDHVALKWADRYEMFEDGGMVLTDNWSREVMTMDGLRSPFLDATCTLA